MHSRIFLAGATEDLLQKQRTVADLKDVLLQKRQMFCCKCDGQFVAEAMDDLLQI